MRRYLWIISTAVLLVMAVVVRADVWDVGPPNDNDQTQTQNELIHGSNQFHDLAAQGGVADVDWYRIGQSPYSSYEVVVDSTSATVGPGLQVQRIAAAGTVLQSATPVTTGLNFSQSLRWENTSSSVVYAEAVQIQSTSCTTTCTANDVYRIRAYETTYSIPRFNNYGTQMTTLIIQNTTSYAITGHLYFWSGTGSLLYTYPFSIPARQLLGLGTNGITALAGLSGSITVAHDGRYGALSGKAVSLESSTGFCFDTPMVPLPN
jgi:hypothetical protein